MKRMAVISAGFVPVPAVDGGAGEVLTTEIINGNEVAGEYYMDIYTIESPKLDSIKCRNNTNSYYKMELVFLQV